MIAADDDTEKSMMDMARAERAELAAFLTTLTLQQWETPSLCAGWSVKEVVAHMISYEDLGVFGLLKRFAKGRIVRANEVGVDEFAGLSPQELVDYVGRHLQPRGLTAGFGGMIALVDGMIHHQDIRRPLGQPRTIPAQRLDRVLRLMPKNPRLRARPRIKGLRLRATDLDWTIRHRARSNRARRSLAHGNGRQASGGQRPLRPRKAHASRTTRLTTATATA